MTMPLADHYGLCIPPAVLPVMLSAPRRGCAADRRRDMTGGTAVVLRLFMPFTFSWLRPALASLEARAGRSQLDAFKCPGRTLHPDMVLCLRPDGGADGS